MIRRQMLFAGMVAAMALVGPPGAAGANVEYVSVFKTWFNRQTSAVDVNLQPPGFSPYEFYAGVSGESIDGIAAPTVTGPITNPEPSHNGGVLGYNGVDWDYGAPTFNGVSVDTQSQLDALFANGTYTINVLGESVDLVLAGDLYPSSPPVMSLTGGTWSSTIYVMDASQPLTITTNTFTEYGTNVLDGISIEVSGPNHESEVTQLSSSTPTKMATLNVPPNTLTPGQSYYVEASFITAADLVTAIPGMPDAFGVAAYEQATELTIQVVPEPTSLALLGVSVLMMMRRRR